MLLEALMGRSSEVRDDEAGLRKESEGRGDGEIAPDILYSIDWIHTCPIWGLLTSEIQVVRGNREWKIEDPKPYFHRADHEDTRSNNYNSESCVEHVVATDV
jgi:hypothetical protein